MKVIIVTDGNATEKASSLEEAAAIVRDWYDYLVEQEELDELPDLELDASDIDSINASIAAWESQIAEALGAKAFDGHGNYYVSAANAAGLNLVVEIEE